MWGSLSAGLYDTTPLDRAVSATRHQAMARSPAVIVTLPPLGESITSANIAVWHVRVGDRVAVGQALVTVQTAKIAIDIPSPYAGQVAALLAAVNAKVGVGDPLLRLD
jgi:pyruvate dehydrogenase E2 component (dihydrolipoamide acetyltransferase)